MPANTNPPIVGIGASAGGVKALQSFFEELPDDPNAAFVVVVHLDPEFRSQLASILSARTRMPVTQIEQAAKLRNNHVYVIAPNSRLVLADHTISAVPFEEPRTQRAPIDLFFRSLAEQHTDGFAYAVILTGAGADGATGVKSIKESGGIVLVQDPNEAEYPSMPRSAIAAEVADFVLPIRELTKQLVELLRDGGRAAVPQHQNDEEQIRRILAHLRVRIGHDFTLYKRATILRRIARRVQVTRKDSLADYYAFLRDNAEEAQALFSDFLISVTTFFRDAEAFAVLAKNAVSQIFEGKEADSDIRVWVPGCATGEEAYTVGILLLEEAARRDLRPEIHVFGSDLDTGSLSIAREGRYPATIEADVSEERLRRYFQREGDHYRVRRELRDIVLFASHSLLRDPPFSRLDLISCRNLLIYLDRELQQQVCNTFHYALNPGGFLFLGASESADNPNGLFRPIDRDARIYRAAPSSAGNRSALPILLGPRQMPSGAQAVRSSPGGVSVGDAMLHRQMLERVAPPSMLVDESHRAVHLSENAGRFLQLSGGPVSTDAAEMVREELRFDLRTGLNRAFDRDEASLSMPLAVRFNGAKHRVYVQVKPVLQENDTTRYALVLFIEGDALEPAAGSNGADSIDGRLETETVRQLQEELQVSNNRLRATREESEATNEELRAANEELQSINEEYRSTSEELETSKEELQSINEELQTVNNELKLKLESVSRAHSDLQNLMAASDFGTLFLDPQLRIKRFTPRLTELFNITTSDEGRPVTDFTHQLDYSDLATHARGVLKNLVPVENEAQSRSGGWFLVRIRPYRTVDDKIDGVVATFVDITERKRAEVALRDSEERLRQFGEASSDVLWIRNAETLQWEYLSPAFESIYGLTRDEALAGDTLQNWTHLILPEDREHAVASIERVRQGEEVIFEYRVRRPLDGKIQWLRDSDFPIRDGTGAIVRVGGIGRNVTELKAAEAVAAASEARLSTLIEGIPQLVWRTSADGLWTWASLQWLDYTGQSQEASQGWGWLDAVHPEDSESTRRAWQEARPHGTLDVEYRVRRASDGAWRWHATRSAPVRDAPRPDGTEGRILEWLGTTTDIDDLKRLQSQQQVLVAELQHRTRNLLAVVRNVAKRSIGPSPGRDEYDLRLAALGRVQGFLSRSPLFNVPLAELVDAELQATGDGMSNKVQVDGPPVQLPGKTVQALALALHELATNAMKYGALAQQAARLSVTWRIGAGTGANGMGDRLALEWRESGVAMPDGGPTRKGYGSELITRALPYQLDAKTTLQFMPDGVWCRIDLPADAFTPGEEPT